MEITKTLKMIMLDRDMKQMDVADRYYTSETNSNSKNTFNNLLRRNDYKLNDIIRIADILDYDVRVQFVDRRTGKTIDVE
jgi:hypothetical protein